MEVKIVYRGLLLGDVPMERVEFDPCSKSVIFELDLENEDRFRVSFEPVAGLRLTPSACFDRRSLYVDGSYQRTILETTKSPWIDALHAGERASREPVSARIKHFLIPSDEGVWEILAERCNRR